MIMSYMRKYKKIANICAFKPSEKGMKFFMRIIGITGKSGSGKSTLAKLLSEQFNCNVINVDKIGHKATSDVENAKKLCEIFGNEILNKNGKIDRKKLGNIVFSNKEKMDILTEITWGYMQNVLDEIIQNEQKNIIILEWLLLPISKYWDKSDIKILMKADDEKRKNKVMQRDQITEEYFLKRDSGSIDYSPYKFDYIFENDYKIDTMKTIVKQIK